MTEQPTAMTNAPLRLTITPRFCDTDLLGHVNNTTLPGWFEQARMPFFDLFCDNIATATRSTFPLVLVQLDLDFRREIRLGTEVEVRTAVARLGTSSFTVRQEAWQSGVLCVEGQVVLVHFDHVGRQALPLTPTQRARLQAWMAPPAPAATEPG